MSVLFKALQKAEKENEQRQAAVGGAGFDPSRLAGSGAIKMGAGRGINWRTAGMAAAVVLAVAIAGAFFLVGEPAPQLTPKPAQIAAVTPAPASTVTNVPPGTTETIPLMQPPAGTPAQPAVAPVMPQVAEVPSAPVSPAPAAPVIATAPPASEHAPAEAAEADIAAAPAESAPPTEVAAAPAPSAKPAAKTAAPAQVAVPRKQPMPDIPADSPARALSPPIAIQRAEFELAGVGNQVQVREVSQKARDNVGAGYDALVSGSYDTSLGFYDRALKDEPTSVLALLGRAASLQKLGKRDEAQAAYNKVLQIDPANREALSNVTMLIADRAPSEALAKLMELEREYPSFSPVKAQIGLTFAKMGSYREALDYLRRASALTPESVMYQYNAALVLDHLGANKQAVAAYESVLAAISGGRAAPDLSRTDIERRVRYLSAR